MRETLRRPSGAPGSIASNLSRLVSVTPCVETIRWRDARGSTSSSSDIARRSVRADDHDSNTPQEEEEEEEDEESGEAVWELLWTSFWPIETLVANLTEERARSFHDGMVGWLEEQRTGDVVGFDRVCHLVSGVRRS